MILKSQLSRKYLLHLEVQCGVTRTKIASFLVLFPEQEINPLQLIPKMARS